MPPNCPMGQDVLYFKSRMVFMFWPIVIVGYIAIVIGVMAILLKTHPKSISVPYAPPHVPFVVSQKTKPAQRSRPGTDPRHPILNPQKADGASGIHSPQSPKASQKPTTAKFIRVAGSEKVNISNVTRDLIKAIIEMSDAEKQHLYQQKIHPVTREQAKAITPALIEWMLTLPMEERCRLLGEYKSKHGRTRRQFERKNYITPVYFAVKGMLQNAYTRNISNGGVLIETLKSMGQKLMLGDAVTLNFAHPWLKKEIKIQGKIIRITPTAIAVTFDTPLMS